MSASGRRHPARPGQGQRGAHQPEELPSRDGIGDLLERGGELPLGEPPVLRRVGELVEAAPVSVRRLHLAHRWHPEQLVVGSMLRACFNSSPDRELITRGLVPHGGDLAHRAQVLLGRAVTIQAPRHVERFGLKHHVHAIDATVAGLAPHPRVHVEAVVEVDEVGRVMDAHPRHRGSGGEALTHRNQAGAVGLDLGVAVHAGLRGGYHGHRGPLHSDVAVAAVHAQITRVQLVAVGHRLLRRVPDLGAVR